MPAPIAITMGDPAGIGPEIVVQLLAQRPELEAVVVGDPGPISRALEILGKRLRIQEITNPRDAHFDGQKLNLLVSSRAASIPKLGEVTAEAGRSAYQAIDVATQLALSSQVRAVVTAPIHKKAIHEAGIPFAGHTEVLAHLTQTADFTMMMANNELRVVLVTIHVALAQAIAETTHANVLRVLRLTHRALSSFGLEHSRLAVAGLNPHAGEDGLFGREDLEHIQPAIADARVEGINATGPYPADTVFMRARRGEFDVVIAQYHDQGLIPIKYLGLEHGVNVTLGLPFVRTSVDHGTAFDLAGTGRADPTSLATACDYAEALSVGRWPGVNNK